MPKDSALKGELVSFPTADGLRLHGFLVRARGRSDRALIHIHGLEGSFYRGDFAKGIARHLAANGINFLTIELRGSYTSTGFRKVKGKKHAWLSAGGGFERFEDCIYDIGGAIRFLGGLGIKKVYLEGHSTGCQKITYYQYKKRDRRVKALILAAPADDYNLQKHELGRRFTNAIKAARILYKRNRRADMPKRYVKRGYSAGRFLSFSDLRFVEARLFNYESNKLKEFSAIRQPILALFGEKEEFALKPVREYMKILKRDTGSRKFDYLIIKGADHGFDGKDKEVARKISDWLNAIR